MSQSHQKNEASQAKCQRFPRNLPLWQRVLLILGVTLAVALIALAVCKWIIPPVYVDTAEVTMSISQEATDRLLVDHQDEAELELDLLSTGLKSEFQRPGSRRNNDLRNGQVNALFYYYISDDLAATYGYDPRSMEIIQPKNLEGTLITGKALGEDPQTLVITVASDKPEEAELVEQVARSAAKQLGVIIFGAEATPEQATVRIEPVSSDKLNAWQAVFRITDEAVSTLSLTKYYSMELNLAHTVEAFRQDSVLQDVLNRAGSSAQVSELKKRLAVKNGIGNMTFTVTWPTGRGESAADLAAAAAQAAAFQVFDRETAEGEVEISPANMLQQNAYESPKTGIIVFIAALIALELCFFLFSGLGFVDCLIVNFFVLFTFICVFPFYYLFINTISDNTEVAGGRVNFLPVGIHFNNYSRILGQEDLYNALLVTVARTVLGTVLMVLTSAWAGYLVTKQKMWHRSFWYRALVITMYFNAGLIPWYTNMLMLGLTGNFLAYIIPGMVAPYNIILVKTYIESIPGSLEESAIIDGATTFKVFLRIILPLSVPILATIAIFGAVGNWNSFQDSLLLMSKTPQLYTLQHRLYIYLNQTTAINTEQITEQTAQNLANNGVTTKYTIAMITIIPILLVYPIMQRYFVKGIMLGAVKG